MGAAAIPTIIAGAGTAMQAAASVQQANAVSQADKFQAQQLQIQQEEAQTAGAQSEAARRRALTQNLGVIETFFGSRNVSGDSPSVGAMMTNAETLGNESIATDQLNWNTRAGNYGLQAAQDNAAASNSELGGFLSGGASLLSGASKLYSLVGPSTSSYVAGGSPIS